MVTWALAATVWAAELRLRLETDTVEVGQYVDAMVVLDATTTGVPRLAVPDGVSVDYVGQSTDAVSINGYTAISQRFQYRLLSTREGRYPIGPATLEVRGDPLTSGTATLVVGPRRADPDAPLRVETVLSADRAYEGQVVLHTYRVLSRVPLAAVNWTNLPTDGFTTLRAAPGEQHQATIEDATGPLVIHEQVVPRLVATDRDLTLTPAVVRVDVPMAGRSRFSLITPVESTVLATESVVLPVRPLPPAPPGFSGLVGDFTITANIAATEVRVGQSVEQVVHVSGDGALDGFALPAAFDQPGVRFYEQAPQVQEGVDGGRFVARGQYRRVVVPTIEGEVTLPAIDLVTFSPTKERYVTTHLDGPTLMVAPGAAVDASMESFAPDPSGRPTEAPVVDGVRPPHATGSATRIPTAPWLLGGAGALLLAILGVLAADLARWRRERPQAGSREPTPRERLQRLPPQGPERLAVLDRALREAIAARLGVPWPRVDAGAVSGLSLSVELGEVLAALDRARFAGEGAPADLQGRVIDLVERLAREKAA